MWSSSDGGAVPEFKSGDMLCAGRFVIEAYEGRGGVGAVYRARDVEVGRTVVCKIAHEADQLAWDESRAQFNKITKINSRDVVKVLGFFVHEYEGERRPVLALEWIDGHDLKDWTSVASVHERFKAVARIAIALAELHAAGLAHGDFQRGINVRVAAADDRIVLIDPDSEITGGPQLTSDRMSLAGIIRGLLPQYVSTTLRAVLHDLDEPPDRVSMRDVAAQIASAARSVPLISLDTPLLVAAQDAYKEETAWRRRKYENIRRHRARTFDRLATQIRSAAAGFGLDVHYQPEDAGEEAMKDAADGQFLGRAMTVHAALSPGRWVIALHDKRGFIKPWPDADRGVIARGVAFIDGEGARHRGDLLELRMVDDVPVVYVATDPGHQATLARMGRPPPDPATTVWRDQTDTWIIECVGDLLGLSLDP